MHHTTVLIARRQARRAHEAGRASPQLMRQLAIGAAVLLALALIVWGVSRMDFSAPEPRRQVARIALMPDTPPPPPPPPPKEAPKESPKEARPQPQAKESPKPPAPANEPLKMEGAAGDGPSAFAAGTVNNDYRGGPVASGPAASGSVADRAAERLYANTVRQLLQAEIERRLPNDAGELSAQFALWVAADGRITRWESDAEALALKNALAASADQIRLPQPPTAAAQPMRFRLTVRAGA